MPVTANGHARQLKSPCQKNASPPGRKRRTSNKAVKRKFRRILENLNRVNEKQEEGELQNAYAQQHDGISMWALWHQDKSCSSELFETVYFYNPKKEAISGKTWIPHGGREVQIEFTGSISTPAGLIGRINHALFGTLKSSAIIGIGAAVGALAGNSALEWDIIVTPFINICAGIVLAFGTTLQEAAMLLGAGILGTVTALEEISRRRKLADYGLRRQLMEFIRNPENEAEVNALMKLE
jgi:hypothetical protein